MSREAGEAPCSLPAVLIEAFSQKPCSGNGAAVVRLQRPLSAAAMQGLAASLKQSETAFLLPWQDDWLLRWFTPTTEVQLCGHATLAAVLALGHWGDLPSGSAVRFHSRSGLLPAELSSLPRAEVPGQAAIVLPSGSLEPAEAPALLLELLQRGPGCGLEGFWRSSLGYAVALLPAEAPLQTMASPAPDLDQDLGRGLILMQPVDCASGPDSGELEPRADYRLRFFAPGLGIPEDPVTGSAHALVAPWWQRRLGRDRLVGWQCSDRPGGVVSQGAQSGMIRLSGYGVLLWDGQINLSGHACATAAGWPLPA